MSDNARPRLSAALAAWTRSAAAEVVVARSVEVVDVDADGAVSVRMLTPIQEVVTGTPRWVDAPILPRIPVAYMSIGDLTITAAPSIGDRGLVLVRDVDHGQVDERQGDPTVSPEDPRRWDPVDAVYLPVALTDSAWDTSRTPATGGAVVLAAGTALRVGSASASSAVALAQQTAARLDRVEAYLNTATYAVSTTLGVTSTTAPSPAPFAGAVAALPRSVASLVATPVAATTEAAVASSRLYTDD
jgi:hypothetical protein